MITFRWFGPRDPIPLAYIRQIPAVRGIVGALFDIPVGEPWPLDRIAALREDVEQHGMSLAVIESIPVHEDIKIGRPTRDHLIDNYCESVRNMGRAGVPVLCYNFMPVFDWMRTDLAHRLDDGSTALAFDDDALAKLDLSRGTADLPGWATAYSADELNKLLDAYRSVTSGAALERVTKVVDNPANGITFCGGSLAADPKNDLPAIVRSLGAKGRIHFAHCRNIKRTGKHSFEETAHPSEQGDIDVHAVLSALHDTGFAGPIRSDHGRMIWGETGQPGYGLHDRALGAMYLHGLWEGITATATDMLPVPR